MFTVNRGTLAFDVIEHGPQDGDPVLLLHGFPQHATAWAGVAARLAARGYRCVAPDQRGYSPGARPSTVRAYAADELVDDVLAVIDAVAGPGGRAHVVGHDWGAIVGWRLAAHHPDRVRSLTAVSVPPPAALLGALRTSRQALASWYVLAFQIPGLAERAFRAGDGAFSRRLVRLLQSSGQARAAAERDAAALADPAALTAALNWYRAARFTRVGDDPPVRVPSLYVWSDGDTAITRPAALAADRYVEGPFRYVELRGTSHWILDEAPGELAELVAAQLAEHPG
jgi:pimeloyl-ACP methyl ester carboxylesterase